MHIDRRLLGWGVFFVLLGAIPLAVRGGLLDEELVRHWPLLWPVLLIGWGLGLLLRRTPLETVGGAIAAITFGIMGGGLIATGFGGFPTAVCNTNDKSGMQAFASQSGTLGANGSFSIEFDCGTLNVSAVDGTDWKLEGSSKDARSPQVTATSSAVTIRAERETGVDFTRHGDDWRISIPKSADLGSLNLTLNAGEGKVDLAGAKVASANVTLNAGSLRLGFADTTSLGSVNTTVNAGSLTLDLPGFSGSTNVSVNAGSLDACVPSGTGLRIHWTGALASHNLDSLGFSKLDTDTWVSQGYDSASSRIQMNISASLGSFALHVGGGCGA